MKRGLKITFLISAILWLVFQSKQFIFQLTNKDLLSSPQLMKYIYDTLVQQIPLLLFAVFIVILLIADFIDKKVKSEKLFYIISAIAFLPESIVDLFDFYNIIILSETKKEIDMIYQPSMKLFAFLIVVSILVFLLTKIFEIEKIKIFTVIFFSVSCIAYMLLIFFDFSSFKGITNNFVVVISSTLFLFIVMLIAVVGIMLKKNNATKTAK